MLKIFDNDFNTDIVRLIGALRFIEENIECKFINLSLGILEYSAELENICCILSKKGYVLISAFDNDGAMSYPVGFDCTIGVDSSELCEKVDQFFRGDGSIVDILAYGHNHRVAWLNDLYSIVVNVYSFDDIHINKYRKKFYQRKLKIAFPNINKINFEEKRGKMYWITTPVLGVFGTSSRMMSLHMDMRPTYP